MPSFDNQPNVGNPSKNEIYNLSDIVLILTEYSVANPQYKLHDPINRTENYC